jgi:hypothetical protein
MVGNRGKIEVSTQARARTATVAAVLGLFAFPFLGCNFDYEKAGTPKPTFPISESPGYEQIRAFVLEPNCLGCHSTRAPLLTSYEAVVASLDAIEDTVLRETPRSARRSMPPSERLSAELRTMLEKWIRDGAPREGGGPDPDPSPTLSPTPPPAGAIPRPMTYAFLKERVLDSKCLLCHATGNPDDAPALDTYAGLYGYASALEAVVIGLKGDVVTPPEQRMPPKDAKPLTAEEKAFFLLWLHDGMPEK